MARGFRRCRRDARVACEVEIIVGREYCDGMSSEKCGWSGGGIQCTAVAREACGGDVFEFSVAPAGQDGVTGVYPLA